MRGHFKVEGAFRKFSTFFRAFFDLFFTLWDFFLDLFCSKTLLSDSFFENVQNVIKASQTPYYRVKKKDSPPSTAEPVNGIVFRYTQFEAEFHYDFTREDRLKKENFSKEIRGKN